MSKSDKSEENLEFKNTSIDEIQAYVEEEFGEQIEDTDIQAGSPIFGEPWTEFVIIYLVIRSTEAGAKRAGELVAEDIYNTLKSRFEEWSLPDDRLDNISQENSPQSIADEMPHRYVVEVVVLDESGDEINRYYGAEPPPKIDSLERKSTENSNIIDKIRDIFSFE